MTRLLVITATLLTAATFGFFYAWIMVMWGLDTLDPAIAATSMVELNRAVRNPLFFVVFAGAPVSVAATVAFAIGRRTWLSAGWFAAGGAVLVIGVVLVTVAGNVPLNNELANTSPSAYDGSIWAAYSGAWQSLNIARTVAAGVALGCCVLGASSMRVTR